MPELRLVVLGSPQLEYDGQPVTLRLRKALALLVYLAVRRQPHSRDALATLFWPDHDQSGGRARLRHALHRLNQAMPGCLTMDAATVQLHQQVSLWLDSDLFAKQVAAGLAAGAPGDMAGHLEAAVALYSDDFLAGFTLTDSPDFDEWQFFERERLRQLLAQALPQLAQIDVQRERYEAALMHARRWLALDPLHEPAHRLLMQLYAWCDQYAAAVRQYQECERILGDELGAAPEEETVQVYAAIKERRLTPPTVTQQPALPVEPAWLPLPLTSFVGREADVAAICEFLTRRGVRLVTLTGTGGVGKTRLALQVARSMEHHFPDGVLLVNLAPINDPELVLPTLAYALGMREGGAPSLLARLQISLRHKRMLLLLDNFEQVARAAPQLTALLSGTLYLSLLVTSRVTLHVMGEQEYPVAPFGLPVAADDHSWERLLRSPAVRLFVDRVQAVRPDFALADAHAPAVAEICRRVDGLALAIELAAAQMRVLTPPALLARLERRLALLTSSSRDRPDRHRTLRDTIASSYELLDPDTQRLFRWLAVFTGGCTLEAIEAVCCARGSADALEGVTTLVNNSLVRQEESNGQPRFTMLETIREYALERLGESGELEQARQCHARYYAHMVIAEASVKVYSREATSWLDWFERELDNIRATLSWSQTTSEGLELGPPLVANLVWLWYRRGYFHEGRRWADRVLATPAASGPVAARALALHASALLAMWQGDLHTAIARGKERLGLVRQLEDELGVATALMNLGVMLVNAGDDAAAYSLLKGAQDLCEQAGYDYLRAITIVHLGNAALGLGNTAEARDWLETATTLSRDIGENWLLAFAVNNLGEVARVQRRYDQARAYYEESEALLRASGDKGDLARLIHNLAHVAEHEGDYARAEMQFSESLEMFRKLGNNRGVAECVAGFAGLRTAQGHAQWGALLLGAAEKVLSTTGAVWWPADRVENERCLAQLRSDLPDELFAAAWAKGQAMSAEQAIQSCVG